MNFVEIISPFSLAAVVNLVNLSLREGRAFAGTIVGLNSTRNWRNPLRILNKLTGLAILSGLLLAACSQSAAQVTSQVNPTAPASPKVSPAVDSTGSQPGCTVVSRQPTPNPTDEALFPPTGEGDWIKGAENASITLLEYSDFQ